VDVREIGRELGVRYVLEGSMRRSGNRLRVTAQLVDAATAGHLWAQNYDGTLEDVFDVQDRITESVVSIVEPMVKRAEIERTRLKPPTCLDAYDLYLEAMALVLTTEPGATMRAIELIERSLALDPASPRRLQWRRSHTLRVTTGKCRARLSRCDSKVLNIRAQLWRSPAATPIRG
jgi:adenylate cyclase